MINSNIHLGIIIPASNITIEKELYSVVNSNEELSKRLFLHFGRAGFKTRYKISKEKYLTEVVKNIPYELEKLSKILQLKNCSFFCTSGTLFLKKEVEIEKKCSEIFNKKLINPLESLMKAFKKLNVLNPLLVTPYSANISEELKLELRKNNISPKKVISLNLTTSSELLEFSKKKLFTLIEEELQENKIYDSICVMCTNFPTFNLINEIEDKFNLPVITSNQATLLEILRDAGIQTKIEKLGRIFK